VSAGAATGYLEDEQKQIRVNNLGLFVEKF
jgi:hypothetical protein